MQSTDISSARSDPSHVSGAMEATLGHHDVRSLVASEQAAQPKRYSTASLSHCKFNATKDAIPKLAAFSLQLTWAANATIVLRDLTCMGWDGNVSSRSTTTVENISIFDCRRQMKLARAVRVRTKGHDLKSGFPYHPGLYDLRVRPDGKVDGNSLFSFFFLKT
jgi:hypothetical protein